MKLKLDELKVQSFVVGLKQGVLQGRTTDTTDPEGSGCAHGCTPVV